MIFNIFYRLIKQASYVLCTDADVNDMVLEYFDKIGVKYYLIENKYVNERKIKAHEYKDKEFLIKQMEHMLLNNKRIICCFDSKTEMDIVVERLKKFCEDNKLYKQLNNFLVYSSTTGDEDDFLCVNDRWKMKNIFYTPKITIGVNFANKIPRDVFLIALGNSINSFGYVQQISRCRNINRLHYYVVNKYQEIRYDNPEDVKVYYTDLIQKYERLHINNKTVENNNTIYNDTIHNDRTDREKLTDIVDCGCASLDYSTGEWILHENVFNDMFFINEYYDNILRSAPREQFRMMLEDKGWNIIKNDESHDDDKKNEIKEAKIKIDEHYDEKCKRALYDNEASLTANEKAIFENAKRRATYLGINFDSKVMRKKYEQFLVDNKVFTQHYAIRLLYGSDVKLNKKIGKQHGTEYNVLNANSLITKIKLIKRLSVILDLKPFDIDTQRDIGRFDEDVEVGDELRDMIKNVFRVRKSKIKTDKYEYWYYQLIQMYKNIVGSDIFM